MAKDKDGVIMRAGMKSKEEKEEDANEWGGGDTKRWVPKPNNELEAQAQETNRKESLEKDILDPEGKRYHLHNLLKNFHDDENGDIKPDWWEPSLKFIYLSHEFTKK